MYKYYLINKPYGMLSQFTREGKWLSLADLAYTFEKDVYPIGRLDADSEGLLLLTNDKSINAKILNPDNHIEKTYLVQVEGIAMQQNIDSLIKGVAITVNKSSYFTKCNKVSIVKKPDYIAERNPPILEKRFPNTTWLSLTITEGKNRQVRKMTASVGLPTLRLIRIQLAKYNLEKYYQKSVTDIRKITF